MKNFPFIKCITCLLIPCLLLLCVGCYSYQTYSPKSEDMPAYSWKSEDMPASEAFVPSIDGKFYRLAYWAVDSVGNLTGIGVVYQSRYDLPHPESATPFEGTLAPETYALAETDEVDFVVKTTDGRFSG